MLRQNRLYQSTQKPAPGTREGIINKRRRIQMVVLREGDGLQIRKILATNPKLNAEIRCHDFVGANFNHPTFQGRGDTLLHATFGLINKPKSKARTGEDIRALLAYALNDNYPRTRCDDIAAAEITFGTGILLRDSWHPRQETVSPGITVNQLRIS